ncbi:MAG: hypothetical protein ACRD4Y_13145 [Candidatus Acidiferrales bacterium]
MILWEHGRALRAPAGHVVMALTAACVPNQVGERTRQKEEQRHKQEIERPKLPEERHTGSSDDKNDKRVYGEPYQVFRIQIIEVHVDP